MLRQVYNAETDFPTKPPGAQSNYFVDAAPSRDTCRIMINIAHPKSISDASSSWRNL